MTVDDKLNEMVDDLAHLAHASNADGCHGDAMRAQAALMAIVALRDEAEADFDGDWQERSK